MNGSPMLNLQTAQTFSGSDGDFDNNLSAECAIMVDEHFEADDVEPANKQNRKRTALLW
jgi:hypothetical protein